MASGHVNRTQSRTHGCTDQVCDVKKVLANSEPSTHGQRSCEPHSKAEHMAAPTKSQQPILVQ